jgi:hypothetical protein
MGAAGCLSVAAVERAGLFAEWAAPSVKTATITVSPCWQSKEKENFESITATLALDTLRPMMEKDQRA